MSGELSRAGGEGIDDTTHQLFDSSYVQTYLQRDVRDLAQVGDKLAFLRFLRACATRTGQLLNMTDLAQGRGRASEYGEKLAARAGSLGPDLAPPAVAQQRDQAAGEAPPSSIFGIPGWSPI